MAYEKAEESLNQRFGKLVVTEILPPNKFGNKTAKCLCDCGNERIASLNKLRKGDTQSCGCLRTQNANRQLGNASKNNPLLKKKLEPKLATAKIVFRRYSDGDLTFEDFLMLSQKNCFYCGCAPSNRTNYYVTKNNKYSKERQINGFFTYNGLDRTDNAHKHDLDNVVPCCLDCNKAKLERSKEEFLNWISRVYNLHFKHIANLV